MFDRKIRSALLVVPALSEKHKFHSDDLLLCVTFE